MFSRQNAAAAAQIVGDLCVILQAVHHHRFVEIVACLCGVGAVIGGLGRVLAIASSSRDFISGVGVGVLVAGIIMVAAAWQHNRQ